MLTSRLTEKSQTTIPKAVRRALSLRPGDNLAYTVHADGVVTVARAGAELEQDPFAAFSEWSSKEDEEAYAGL